MSESEILKLAFQQGLPTLLILGVAAFIAFRVWPWWTKEYWPSKQKADMELRKLEMARDDRRDAALEALRATLAELPMALSNSTGIAVKEYAGVAVGAAETNILAAINAAKVEALRGQEALLRSQETLSASLGAKIDTATAAARQGAFNKDAVQEIVRQENEASQTKTLTFIGALMRPSGAQSVAEGKTQ